jgi:hypothetical protein
MIDDLKKQKKLITNLRYEKNQIKVRIKKTIMEELKIIVFKLKPSISITAFINQLLRKFIDKK